MDIFSKLRRNIINEGSVYKIKDLFGDLIKENQTTLLDDPEFYDISTKTLKLGNLCARDIKENKTPKINIGGKMYTTYCALAHLTSILEPNLVPKFHYNIDKIYNFLRRDLKYDNRVKFHSLLKTILEYDDPANTMNIIVTFIEGEDNVDEIAVALDRFRKSEEVTESEIDEFLRRVKSAGHQEYEKSFYGDHFQKYQTRLSLKYKTEEENLSILKRIEDVIDGKYTVEGAVNSLYKNINENYSAKEMIKADLKCIKSVYDKNGDVVIKKGELIEVKKIDYAADSYLSEFMAMYKSSQLPDYAHEANYIKIYNQIIDGLYQKFKSRGDILEDVKSNFAGIIYDDKIFIDKEDVELYWSNKGRSSCLKDHRLSIRYRIKSSSLMGYVYEGGDVLTEKPIKINLSTEKILCPITKPKKLKESYNLKQISNLLLEGRKEDIIKKYGNEDQSNIETINYFSGEDPSGNNKYLEWMTKNWLGLGKDKTYAPLDYEIAEVIKLFHRNIQRIQNKDINSYSYKELRKVVKKAEKQRKEKELEKEAKKQKKVIYEDNKWLVISPKSWKASCYYGAGTKWCVTSKNTDNHWNNYSRKATFFFVIDKEKNKSDRYYKVAYRKIGRGNKFELWDAEDLEFSKRAIGRDWLESLPDELKERIESHHSEMFPKIENLPEWVNDNPEAQAIFNHLGNPDIEYLRDNSWYSLNIFEIDGEYWVAAQESDMDDALWDYLDGYDDNELLEYYDYDGDYLIMNDESYFVDTEVSEYLANLNEREIVENVGKDDELAELEDDLSEARSDLENAEEEENEEEIEELEAKIEELEDDIEVLHERAKDALEDSLRDDWFDCLSQGPVECLVNDKGWFRNARELLGSGLVWFDRDDLIDNITNYDNYELVTPYGYDEDQDDDGDWYYVFQVDI